MFSRNFPEVKSPEQIAFEGKVEEIITGDEIDLDDLSAADYVTSDEDERDDETMIEILEELEFLGPEPKKRKMTENKEENVESRKKNKTETEGSKATEENGTKKTTMDNKEKETKKTMTEDKEKKTKKTNFSKQISEMDEIDRKAVGAFFLSIKEMRKAAKLNLRALTRLHELARKYPCVDFLYKMMKPISEIMPENPINTVTPIFQMVGVKAATGGQKYDTESIVKIVPRRIVVDGRIKHKCSACEFEKVSWGAVNTHIMKVHVGQSYVCSKCAKILTSMDGLRRHMQKQHEG